MPELEDVIAKLRSDELGNMLYLEVKEIVSRTGVCESVDDYIERIWRNYVTSTGYSLPEQRSA